ncbi:hypothetical protein ACHAW5_004922 [Stephanodiscus triporus]|uniref:Selenoprotein T n=1 Tax=Stephanodiscus triporus TaxID=2934178 RepID=A0ABD3N7K3_9STRA
MKANFLRLREVLQSEFPGQWNSIHGENYPAPDWTGYAGALISAVQLFAMVLVMVGESLWTYVPGLRRPPEFYYKMKDNPALTFIVVFLVIPSYVQSFANTGAFEIYVDEKLIFSKLETGRMPNLAEVVRALESVGLKRRA